MTIILYSVGGMAGLILLCVGIHLLCMKCSKYNKKKSDLNRKILAADKADAAFGGDYNLAELNSIKRPKTEYGQRERDIFAEDIKRKKEEAIINADLEMQDAEEELPSTGLLKQEEE